MNSNRIFLCHASEDKEMVVDFYYKLKSEGYNPWLDKVDILPGYDWDREIRNAIKESQIMIIFFSNNSVSKRGYVQREYKLALETLEEIPENKVFIIPIRIDNCRIPEQFHHIQYIDLFRSDSWSLILQVIKSELGSTNEFTDIRDGQTYKVLKLKDGNTWLAENLRYKTESECWSYNNLQSHKRTFGFLYSWDSAKEACPKGWRLPSYNEWKNLINLYGGPDEIGDWEKPVKSLLDGGTSGLNLLLGGNKFDDSNKLTRNYYEHLGEVAYYWSNTYTSDDLDFGQSFVSKGIYVFSFTNKYPFTQFVRHAERKSGLSCRCIKIENEI